MAGEGCLSVLTELVIANLGVIEHASVHPAAGFTVLTGETGAGKTMLIEGVRLLRGERADASRVRDTAERASVDGHFTITPARAEALHNDDIDLDENGELVITRSITVHGRSSAHLGGVAVPASRLREATGDLVTIHGQHDQLRLMNSDAQRDALDSFDPAIAALRANYEQAYRQWTNIARTLRERVTHRRELAQEIDRLSFALEEIGAINPQPGEEEELSTRIRRLSDLDTLRAAATTALTAIDGDEDALDDHGASTAVGAALTALRGAEDPQLHEVAELVDTAGAHLREAADRLSHFLTELPTDDRALQAALERQQALRGLTRKYAADLPGVIAWREAATERLAGIDISTEAIEQMKDDLHSASATLEAAQHELTAARTEAATRLGEAVTAELHGLAMASSTLTVSVTPTDRTRHGADEVEFLLNGKKLSTAASGGELSRVMLALEVLLSTGGTTLVFDEVDQGVGGRAAGAIGQRLAALARTNQVIVVTHLPQVAAYAHTHIHVAKAEGHAPVSQVHVLTEAERVEEIARMLAGLDGTETGRAHAQELLERAHQMQ